MSKYKPTTDAEAKQIVKHSHAPMPPELDALYDKGLGDELDELVARIYFLRGTVDRLLRDRDVMLEIISGFAKVMREEYNMGDPLERATDRASIYKQANALLAAVRGMRSMSDEEQP